MHRNQISHPRGNLAQKRYDRPSVSFGKASLPQLVLDSSPIQVFIMLVSDPFRENIIGENLAI